jgi:hypothetical protein
MPLLQVVSPLEDIIYFLYRVSWFNIQCSIFNVRGCLILCDQDGGGILVLVGDMFFKIRHFIEDKDELLDILCMLLAQFMGCPAELPAEEIVGDNLVRVLLNQGIFKFFFSCSVISLIS